MAHGTLILTNRNVDLKVYILIEISLPFSVVRCYYVSVRQCFSFLLINSFTLQQRCIIPIENGLVWS